MKTKKTVSFFLAFLLLFVSLITSLFEVTFSATKTTKTIEASAEETTDYATLEQIDENFGWGEGAAINYGEEDYSDFGTKLKFDFNVNNLARFKFTNANDQAYFYFTVCRVTEKKYVPIYKLIMICYPEALIIGHQQMRIEDVEASDQVLPTGAISVTPYPVYDINVTREEIEAGGTGKTFENKQELLLGLEKQVSEKIDGFMIDSYHVKEDVDFSKIYDDPFPLSPFRPNSIGITININSPFSQYCVVADYILKEFDNVDEAPFWKFWEEDKLVFKEYKGTLKSSTRSVKDVLQNMNDQGVMEDVLLNNETMILRAYEILGVLSEKEVTVRYLKQIGSSPFATRLEKKITVSVLNDRIFYDDVMNALGVDTLNLLGATVGSIDYEGSDVYNVKYLSSAHVEAKTADGNLKDYFLRLEKSLDSYYRQYVEDGVFEEALIEYMLNDAKLRHPELTAYEAHEIYGLWGYVVVPESNSFNSLFADVFNKPTNFSGTYFHFASHDTLSISEYNTLLEEYDYGWITRIWESAKEYMVGDWTHECTHYLFYADPKYQEVNIGENGGDLGETGGAIQETIKDGVEDIRNSIEENASWWRWTKAIIAIVGVVAGVLGVVYVLVKIGVIGGSNGSAKTKPKKKKK